MYIRWQRGIHGCRENYKKITRDHWTLCDTLYSIIRGTPRVVEQLRPTGYRINTLARRIYEKHTGGLRSFGRRLSLSDDFNISPDSFFASICVCIYIIDRSCTRRFLLILFFFLFPSALRSMLKIPQLRSCWAFVRGARATTSTRSTTIRHEHNFPRKGTNTTLSSSPTVATTTSRALTGRRRTVRNIPSETAGKSSTRGEVMSAMVVVVVMEERVGGRREG